MSSNPSGLAVMSISGPSPEQIREFAKLFTRQEWEILCHLEEFREALMTNLARAQKIATKTLKTKIKEEKRS